MFRFNVIVLSLTLTGGLIAQGESCPDQVIETVEPSIQIHAPQSCGSNVNASVGGVSVHTGANICPLLVIVRPGHDTTVERRGSGTFTKPVETVPIQLGQFQCQARWLLGFIPIVITSECVPLGWTNAGKVTHYAQHPCRNEVGPGDETGDEPEHDTGAGRGPGADRARWERTP